MEQAVQTTLAMLYLSKLGYNRKRTEETKDFDDGLRGEITNVSY